MKIYPCHTCNHCRERVIPELHLSSVCADSLRIQSEWLAEWKRREQDEYQRFLAGEPFLEEPFLYPWCLLFTRYRGMLDKTRDGRGKRVRLYVLCSSANPHAECARHTDFRKERCSKRSSEEKPA